MDPDNHVDRGHDLALDSFDLKTLCAALEQTRLLARKV